MTKSAVAQYEDWDVVIDGKSKWWSLGLKEAWQYRDLLFLFIKRNFISTYKQTLLGPLWFFIQPILTTITFTIIFGNIAQLPTDGMPKILFYLSGITMWGYFANCLSGTSNTFIANQGIFGKVYFPRILVPLSVIITNLLRFAIQLVLLVVFFLYYYIFIETEIHVGLSLFLFPLLVLMMALLGMGFGLVISALTTKYRDFNFLIGFAVQLLMYASPVVYPLSMVPYKYKFYLMLNPMSGIIETFKFSLLGIGELNLMWLLYSALFSICIFFIGIILFNRTEKSFIDTV